METPRAFLAHRSAVYALTPGGGPEEFLSGGGDGRVIRWNMSDPDSGTVLLESGEALFSLYHAAASGLLFAGTESGVIHVLSTNGAGASQELEQHEKGVFGFLALADGRMVATGGDGALSIWGIQEGRVTHEGSIPLSDAKLRGSALSANGTTLAIADGTGAVHILDASSLQKIQSISAHEKGAQCVAWHPAKPVLLSGGRDGHIRCWHTEEAFRPLLAIPAHTAGIYAIDFHSSRRYFATASRDKTAKIWDAATMDPVLRLDRAIGGHGHSVNAVLWTEAGLITAGDDKRVLLWKGVPPGVQKG